MGWKGDQYFYSTETLKDIARSYDHIYEGIEFHRGGVYRYTDTDCWSIVEFKADFDNALRGVGKGKWTDNLTDFKNYHNFGKLQQIIIADIMGIDDNELERLGFYSIPRLRGYAYYLMKKFLNNGG